jgi:hypothetical protein
MSEIVKMIESDEINTDDINKVKKIEVNIKQDF